MSLDIDAALDAVVADKRPPTCHTCIAIADTPEIEAFIQRGIERRLYQSQIRKAIERAVGIHLSGDSLQSHIKNHHVH